MHKTSPHLRRPAFEKPVEAEAPVVADLRLELVPRPIPQLVHHAHLQRPWQRWLDNQHHCTKSSVKETVSTIPPTPPHQEAVLLLGVGLALGGAIQDLELLPGVLVALQLGGNRIHDVLLPLDALLTCSTEGSTVTLFTEHIAGAA